MPPDDAALIAAQNELLLRDPDFRRELLLKLGAECERRLTNGTAENPQVLREALAQIRQHLGPEAMYDLDDLRRGS
jgi:hypothetical protein